MCGLMHSWDVTENTTVTDLFVLRPNRQHILLQHDPGLLTPNHKHDIIQRLHLFH